MTVHSGGGEVDHLVFVHVDPAAPDQRGHEVVLLLGRDALVARQLGLEVGEGLGDDLLQEHDVRAHARQRLDDGPRPPLEVLLVEAVDVPCDEGEVGGGRGGQHPGLQRGLHVDVVILTSRPRASLRAPILLLRCPLSLQLLTFCSKVLFSDPDKSQLFSS